MLPGLTLAFATRTRSPRIGRYVRHLRQSCGLERVEVLYRINPGTHSLAVLYNQFLAQARYQIVVLLHDDLIFARGAAWGRRIVDCFAKHPDFAVLSAAGSVSLAADGIYWQPLPEMLGQVRHRLGAKAVHNRYSEAFEQPLEALVLDGLMLAVHRQRVRSRFDERIPGFHFYDIAFSLSQSLAHQRGEGGRCGVLSGLGVSHQSGGDTGMAFEVARQRFLRLYRSLLPAQIRPALNLRPVWGVCAGPSVLVAIRHQQPSPEIKPLLMRMQASAYRDISLLLCHAGGPGLAGLPAELAADVATAVAVGWEDYWAAACRQAEAVDAEYVLLLDARVLPLQDWIPAMVSAFLKYPRLGTLGVRLHYPDTHLLYHNGLEMFYHRADQPDVAFKGIHSPYRYRNAWEWNPTGSVAHALMCRRDQLAHFGLSAQDWVPGLELNLGLARAGWHNAVDSRLVGYWLGEDSGDAAAYKDFLRQLQISALLP